MARCVLISEYVLAVVFHMVNTLHMWLFGREGGVLGVDSMANYGCLGNTYIQNVGMVVLEGK